MISLERQREAATNKPPAFQFYVRDWLASNRVRRMSLEAKGAYIELLATAWNNTPVAMLPLDPEELREMAGATPEEWQRIWPKIEPLLPVVRKKWRSNLRLLLEYRCLLSRRKLKSEQGKAGAKARWDNMIRGNGIVSPLAENSSASAFASASALKDLKPADASPIPRRFRGKAGKELVRERIAEHFDHKKETEDRRKIQAMHERIVREQAAEIMKHVAPVTH